MPCRGERDRVSTIFRFLPHLPGCGVKKKHLKNSATRKRHYGVGVRYRGILSRAVHAGVRSKQREPTASRFSILIDKFGDRKQQGCRKAISTERREHLRKQEMCRGSLDNPLTKLLVIAGYNNSSAPLCVTTFFPSL